MSNLESLIIQNEFFSTKIVDKTFLISIDENPFSFIQKVEWCDSLLKLLHKAEELNSIHSILFIISNAAAKKEYYDQFLDNIFIQQESDEKLPAAKNSQIKNERIRQLNLIDRLITNIVELNKITIFAMDGEIVTPIVGLSLAADYRIISTRSSFVFSHALHGIHPGGALPFFISKYLNPELQNSVLVEGNTLDSEQIMNYMLASEIIEDKDFKEFAIKYSINLNRINLNVMKAKKLLLSNRDELKKYFAREERLFFS